MMRKLGRLFLIKNRFEACAIIYALALGGAERGKHYLDLYPGFAGRMLFVAAMVAVFMAGAKIMDALTYERKARLAAAHFPTPSHNVIPDLIRDPSGLAGGAGGIR